MLGASNGEPMEKYILIDDLMRKSSNGGRLFPLSKATLYRMIASGAFPKPRRLGRRSVWAEQEIQAWHTHWLGNADD